MGDLGGGVGIDSIPADAVAVPQDVECLALDMDGLHASLHSCPFANR